MALGRLFAALVGHQAVRLRLEYVADDACSEFHVDRILLCIDEPGAFR